MDWELESDDEVEEGLERDASVPEIPTVASGVKGENSIPVLDWKSEEEPLGVSSNGSATSFWFAEVENRFDSCKDSSRTL